MLVIQAGFLWSRIPSLLGIPFWLFAVGWVGTERLWYLRIYRGQPLRTSELWKRTWGYVWRYLRLGLLATVLFIPVIVLALSHGVDTTVAHALERTNVVVVFTLAGFVGHFALTFVTPALALTTNRVGDALRIGLRLLRAQWPRSAWYALIPSLALLSVMSMRRGMTSDPFDAIAMTFAGVHTVLALCFKGATVGFYDRHVLATHSRSESSGS